MRKLPVFAAAVGAALGLVLTFMPPADASRNSSGTYTLPTGNPVVPGTTISSTWANSTLGDISTELTDSLSRSGSGAMLAPLKLNSGTLAAPGLSFDVALATGLYWLAQRGRHGRRRRRDANASLADGRGRGHRHHRHGHGVGGHHPGQHPRRHRLHHALRHRHRQPEGDLQGVDRGATIQATVGAANGAGVIATGAGAGDGLAATDGPASGLGVRGTGGAPNGYGMAGIGMGTGQGIEAVGGAGGAACWPGLAPRPRLPPGRMPS
ncbi:hypothetical protein D7X99_12390 [Corallococcus sp. AB032C]|nr:hypothetical protein [Corallococcus exiguus]NPC47113.1 hypothetical protein [Corallococcus exiguus]RKH83637.1 hypothetical protein D7X99_12390 [Corallococcus sp. AB032C]